MGAEEIAARICGRVVYAVEELQAWSTAIGTPAVLPPAEHVTRRRTSPRASENGLAAVWDADVLIWATSQIVAAETTGCEPHALFSTSPIA